MVVVDGLMVEVLGVGVGVDGDGVTGFGVVVVVVVLVVVVGTSPLLFWGAWVGAGV